MDTERPSPRYTDIDVWDPSDILEAMIGGQFSAVAAVRAALPEIERAALGIEQRLKRNGRLIYAGAGTSGRLAVQDGAELMPTFSWPRERLLLLIAGGDEAMVRAVEGAEDEVAHARELVKQHRVHADDVLVAVAASGPSRRGQPLDKADRPAPVSAYGKSKADGEQAVMESGVPDGSVVMPLNCQPPMMASTSAGVPDANLRLRPKGSSYR